MFKTLVISEDQVLITELKKLLEHHLPDFELQIAVNKQQAIEYICYGSSPSFFIMDFNIKSFDLFDFVETVTELAGTPPMLFVCSDIEKITKDYLDLNDYNYAFEKSSVLNDQTQLKDTIIKTGKYIIDLNNRNALEEVDPKDFIKMRLKALYFRDSFPYDIYLEITPTRYQKIIPATQKYGHSFVASYAKRNVKFFQVKKDEQLEFLEEEIKGFILIFEELEKKSYNYGKDNPYYILLRAMNVFYQYINAIGVTHNSQKIFDHMVHYILHIVSKSNNLHHALKDYPSFYDGIASKSILTAIFSLYTAKEFSWDSKNSKNKLVAASLLQDITLQKEEWTKISGILDPKYKELTKQDKQVFHEHPSESAKLASQFSNYPDVDFLIKNHHERPNKKGFPHKPNTDLFNTVLCLFNICSELAARVDGQDLDGIDFKYQLMDIKRCMNTQNGKESIQMLSKAITKA